MNFKFRSESIIVSKTDFSRFIFLILLTVLQILFFFVSNKITWLLFLLYLLVIVMSRMKFVLKPQLLLMLFLLPVIWSLAMSFNSDFYHVSQGFFYLTIPLIFILIGYQLYRIISLKMFLSYLVIAGNLIALLFIIFTVIKVGFVAFVSPYTEARFVVGPGSFACILSLVISAYSKHFNISIFRNNQRRYFSILINLVAIYLFASRTYWVILFVFIIIFSISTIRKDRFVFNSFILLGMFLLAASILKSSSGLSFTNSILFKLVNSFTEIKVSKFSNMEEITTYYRGYEAYRSWITYSQGNPLELVFGGGMGQLVDLKAKVFLAGSYWTKVPWVHNGFFFILVKMGALGLLFNLFMFIYLLRSGFRRSIVEKPDFHFKRLLIIGCAISLFISTFVICGLFNLEMAILLITIGFLIQGLSNPDNISNILSIKAAPDDKSDYKII